MLGPPAEQRGVRLGIAHDPPLAHEFCRGDGLPGERMRERGRHEQRVSPGGWSWSGSWGPKPVALRGLLRPLMAQFTDYRCEADFVLADEDRVVVQARGHGTTTSGTQYEQTYGFILRMADGKIT